MLVNFKQRLMKKWWFRWIRNYTWFSFRYWWLNYLMWTLFISLLIWLITLALNNLNTCNEDKEINQLLRNIDRQLENCCDCKVVETEIDSVIEDTGLDSLRDSLNACNGDITITLAWKTSDDLDLHLVEPDGTTVYYGKPRSRNGADLDIDMNADEISSTPIENICYRKTPPRGRYRVKVDFFSRKSQEAEIPYTIYVRNGSSEKYFTGVHTREKDMHLIYEFNFPE